MHSFFHRRMIPAAMVLAAGSLSMVVWNNDPQRMVPSAVLKPAVPHAARPFRVSDFSPSLKPRATLGSTQSDNTPDLLSTATAGDWFETAKHDQLLSLMLQWAEIQPQSAVAWIGRVPHDLRATVQQELAGAVMAQRPLAAMSLLSSLPQDRIIDQMLRQAAMEYATAEPSNALIWARQQPEEDIRTLMLGAVLCALANHDPSGAAEGLYELPDGLDQEVVVVEVVQRWAQKNAPEAGAFVAKLSESVAVPSAENLILEWAAQDKDASLRWVADIHPPFIREAATAAWMRATSYLGGLEISTMEPAAPAQ